jgi:rubrerythrin
MARAAQPILVPTAETGATAARQAPMVTIVDERLVDLTAVAELSGSLGLAGDALADQLSAFVTHERCGVHLYRSVAARTEVEDLRGTYVQFGDETLRHVEIYTNVIEALGGDPLYVSAAARCTEKANAAVLESTFMLTGSADPATRELAMIEAVGIAETKCHANWELLEKLAFTLPEGEPRRAMEAAVAEVKPQEDEHLTWATTARERFVLGLVAPGFDFTAVPYRDVEEDAEDLESWSKSELYERAQELDIAGRSSMNKDELAEAVRDAQD